MILIIRCNKIIWGFPGGSDGKTSACNAGDPGLIPGSGRSPGEGNGNPLQHSYLKHDNFLFFMLELLLEIVVEIKR